MRGSGPSGWAIKRYRSLVVPLTNLLLIRVLAQQGHTGRLPIHRRNGIEDFIKFLKESAVGDYLPDNSRGGKPIKFDMSLLLDVRLLPLISLFCL